jgi:hypothetical protein
VTKRAAITSTGQRLQLPSDAQADIAPARHVGQEHNVELLV